jgi:D-arabinose 5-phosphate isomerase GutQ
MTSKTEKSLAQEYADVCLRLKADFPGILGDINSSSAPDTSIPHGSFDVFEGIQRRLSAINRQTMSTVDASRPEIEQTVGLFLRWMQEGTIVRVVAAGRARLAAAIPANRLAHGGARVFIKDDIIPMPHTIKGGGIIAASASGRTVSVLTDLSSARRETRDIEIIGIAAADAEEFKSFCDIFIGIQPEPEGLSNPLRALADSEEYVISELLDAMVVSAGKLGGFVDTLWRIGHENLGPTGPYDFKKDVL